MKTEQEKFDVLFSLSYFKDIPDPCFKKLLQHKLEKNLLQKGSISKKRRANLFEEFFTRCSYELYLHRYGNVPYQYIPYDDMEVCAKAMLECRIPIEYETVLSNGIDISGRLNEIPHFLTSKGDGSTYVVVPYNWKDIPITSHQRIMKETRFINRTPYTFATPEDGIQFRKIKEMMLLIIPACLFTPFMNLKLQLNTTVSEDGLSLRCDHLPVYYGSASELASVLQTELEGAKRLNNYRNIEELFKDLYKIIDQAIYQYGECALSDDFVYQLKTSLLRYLTRNSTATATLMKGGLLFNIGLRQYLSYLIFTHTWVNHQWHIRHSSEIYDQVGIQIENSQEPNTLFPVMMVKDLNMLQEIFPEHFHDNTGVALQCLYFEVNVGVLYPLNWEDIPIHVKYPFEYTRNPHRKGETSGSDNSKVKVFYLSEKLQAYLDDPKSKYQGYMQHEGCTVFPYSHRPDTYQLTDYKIRNFTDGFGTGLYEITRESEIALRFLIALNFKMGSWDVLDDEKYFR